MEAPLFVPWLKTAEGSNRGFFVFVPSVEQTLPIAFEYRDTAFKSD